MMLAAWNLFDEQRDRRFAVEKNITIKKVCCKQFI